MMKALSRSQFGSFFMNNVEFDEQVKNFTKVGCCSSYVTTKESKIIKSFLLREFDKY